MTAYHYVYSITYTDLPNIYYGVRTSKRLPEKDKYWGSPSTFKEFMDAHKATRVKTILATYPTREEAELAEDELIEKQWEINKSLSLNACINGTKFNTVGKKNSLKQKESVRLSGLASAKNYYLISPSGEIFQGRCLRSFCTENNLHEGDCSLVRNGKKLHFQGWTSSLEAHKIYLQAYLDRGICWHKGLSKWCVQWREEGKQRIVYFKEKQKAIIYRDQLIERGYKFTIHCPGWKNKLAALDNAA